MKSSVSWVMKYHRRPCDTRDRVGGVPEHMPSRWPVCQLCQEQMAFVGQLYESDQLLLGDCLALQFYVCDNCRRTFRGQANDEVPIHMEMVPRTAPLNTRRTGVRSKLQPIRYISYTPIEDSMDQWTFSRRELGEEELPDGHLRADKIGGLFPYDGDGAPRITKRNRLIAQFSWEGIHGPIYLYTSPKRGIYLYHYR